MRFCYIYEGFSFHITVSFIIAYCGISSPLEQWTRKRSPWDFCYSYVGFPFHITVRFITAFRVTSSPLESGRISRFFQIVQFHLHINKRRELPVICFGDRFEVRACSPGSPGFPPRKPPLEPGILGRFLGKFYGRRLASLLQGGNTSPFPHLSRT